MFIMNIPAPVREMTEKLQENGFAAYLVGGCVRDALTGLTPHDYDIATDAVPEEIISLFGEEHCTWYGRAFGTVCVRNGSEKAEITTFRTESDYTDSRHPGNVAFAKHVEDDLSRRDFTCNAIAYDPRSGLCDPYHGQDDLKAGILRAVGDPLARFTEDALRILRGMRFYARFGLEPEAETDRAMRELAPNLKKISVERVFSELCGMLTGAHITEALLRYPDILAVWIPEIMPCVGFDQKSRWHDFTVWEHIARSVGNIPPELTLRMTMLFHDIAKPDCFTLDERGGHFKGHAQLGAKRADVILQRLRCDNKMRSQVTELIDLHRITPKNMPTVRRLLGQIGEEQMHRLMHVLEADRISKWKNGAEPRDRIDLAETLLAECLEEHLCCTVREMDVRGDEIAALGLQGRQISEALNCALEEIISERLPNDHDEILSFIKSLQT